MDGIINVYKPVGMTSHDVVYKVRRITGIKKVGHTGTLDPDADGVLPICIGKGTRLSDMLTFSDKRYTAVMRLGITTDTLDLSGNVLETKSVDVQEEEIRLAVSRFVGEITQVPPMYSAVKVGGKKLYELARKGIEVERKPRKVTVYDIKILGIEGNDVSLDIFCSKGTYIRSICADIGDVLRCGAAVARLTRTQSSVFKIGDSVTLETLEEGNIKQYLTAVDEMFEYPKVYVDFEQAKKIKNGCSVKMCGLKAGQHYRVYDENNDFLCISKESNGCLVLVKSFYGG